MNPLLKDQADDGFLDPPLFVVVSFSHVTTSLHHIINDHSLIVNGESKRSHCYM